MLKISSKSNDAFIEISMNRFRNHLLSKVDLLLDDEKKVINDYGDEAFVDTVLQSANDYNIEYEKDIDIWFDLLAVNGVDFGRDEDTRWAGKILDNESLDGELKIESILAELESSAPED